LNLELIKHVVWEPNIRANPSRSYAKFIFKSPSEDDRPNAYSPPQQPFRLAFRWGGKSLPLFNSGNKIKGNKEEGPKPPAMIINNLRPILKTDKQ